MDDRTRRFLERQRVAHLATADARGAPHVVPVCFALLDDTLYIAIDEKPKQADIWRLRRMRNIAANPQVAVVADVYDDADWSRLGFALVRGRARVLNVSAANPIDAQALPANQTEDKPADPAPHRNADQAQDQSVGAPREHARAVGALREKYTQYTSMALDQRPIIAVDIESATSWGRLDD